MKLSLTHRLLTLLTLSAFTTAFSETVSTFNYNGTNFNATTWATGATPTAPGIVIRSGNTTASSNVITSISSTVDIGTGMVVTGTNVPAGTVVTAVTTGPLPTDKTVKLSNNCTATGSSISLTFMSPWNLTRPGKVTAGVNQITDLLGTNDLVVGMSVIGTGITGVVTITQILSPTSVQISSNAASTQTNFQTYTFAVSGTAGGAGNVATLNLDFGPGRALNGVTKDVALPVAGVLTNYTLDSDPIPSSLAVSVIPGTPVKYTWSQLRGSSSAADVNVSYNPSNRQLSVTLSAAAVASPGTTLRITYTNAAPYIAKQIGDAVDRIGQTNGVTIAFGPVILSGTPVADSLMVTDGVYAWSEQKAKMTAAQSGTADLARAGSTNPSKFWVTWVPGTLSVTVNYAAAADAPTGRTILASYARSGAPAVTLGTLVIGDISGGEQVGVRLGSLTMQGGNGAQAQINKTVGGDDEIISAINLANTTAVAVRTGGDTFNSMRIGGSLTGTGGLVKLDSGNLTLLGNNTYTGNTYIKTTGGTTFLRAPTGNAISSTDVFIGNSTLDGNASSFLQLEASNQINDAATLWFDGASGRNAYLKMMGNNESVSRIIDYTGQGVIENVESDAGVAGTGTLTVSGNSDSFFNGFMRDKANNALLPGSENTSNGRLGLTKTGTGTLTIQGGNVSYSGATTVSGGTLKLSNINNPLGGALPSGTGSTTAPRFDSNITNNSKVILDATTDWAYGTALTGTGEVVKTGGSTVRITGTLDYTGTTTISAGTLRLQSGLPAGYQKDQFGNFTRVFVNNAQRLDPILGLGQITGSSAINIAGGTLLIDNTSEDNQFDSAAGGAIGHIADTIAINSTGGTLQFNHNAGDANYAETLGSLTMNSGHLTVLTSQAKDGFTSKLILNSLTHTKGGTFGLQGSGVGGKKENESTVLGISASDKNQALVLNNPMLVNSPGIIGGWATTTNSKVKNDGTVLTDAEFLTWDSATGRLKAFDAYDLVTSTTNQQSKWTVSNNVRISDGSPSVTISGKATVGGSLDRTINSLNMDSGGARTLNLGGRTLTIATGGIIARGNTHTVTSGKLTAGTAGQGQNELFVNVADGITRQFVISSAIVDQDHDNNTSTPALAVTVVKNGVGELALRGVNTYTGGTIVNQGIIEVQTIGALGGLIQKSGPNVGNLPALKSDYLVLNGGTFQVPSPTGTVTQTMVFESNMGVTLGERGGIFALNPRTIVNFKSPIIGSGDLLMGGAGGSDGVLQLNGNNTFSGRLRVDFGTIEINGGSNLFETLSIEGGAVTINNGAALPGNTLGSSPAALGMAGGSLVLQSDSKFSSLSGAGSITSIRNSGQNTLIIDQEGVTSFTGRIEDRYNTADPSAGVLNLEKRGKGTLRLTGDLSSYRGETRIVEGILAVTRADYRGTNIGASWGLGVIDTLNDFDLPSANFLQIGNGAALSYIGAAPSITDRPFTIGTGDVGAGIYANGTRLGDTITMVRGRLLSDTVVDVDGNKVVIGEDMLGFSTPNAAATLILGGLNTGNNTFEHSIPDNGTGVVNLTKTGTGTWLLGDPRVITDALPAFDSTYSGKTTIYAGTLRLMSDKALGATGGPAVHLVGGNLDLDVAYLRQEDLAMMGGRLRTISAPNRVASWAGGVRLDVSSTIEVRDNQTLTLGGTISGTSSLRKEGFGTLVLSGNNSLRGGTTVAEGTLRLDYRTNTLSKLADGAGLGMGGGREGGVLDIIGGTVAAPNNIREDVSSLTLSAGLNKITRSDAASTTKLRLNGFGINQGGLLDIQAAPISDPNNNLADTDRNNVNGILGSWMTIGGKDWAANSINGADGAIKPVATYTLNSWAAGNQTDVTANATLSNALTNSLRFNSPVSTTINLIGDNTIFTNGILQTPSVGVNSNIISGGRLVLNNDREGGNLVIHQNDAEGFLRISSVIANAADIQGVRVNYNAAETFLTVVGGSTAGLTAGMPIAGTGIPAGATITSVTATEINISLPTDGAANGVAPHIGALTPLVVNTGANSATITVTSGVGSMTGINVGMPFTGPGIPDGTFITSVNMPVLPSGTPTFTLSRNATVAQTGITPNVGGLNNLVVSTTAGSATLNITSGTTWPLYIGMPVSGAGIPLGATITGFSNNNSFNISAAATATATGVVPTVTARNGVVKSGAGISFLSGNNTFTGPIVVVGGTLSVLEMNNYGATGALGSSNVTPFTKNGFNNLVIAGATLQYTGNTATTDRGFKVNELANIDVALSGTVLTVNGNLSGGDGVSLGRLRKTGSGTLEIGATGADLTDANGFTSRVLQGGATNIGALEVSNGVLGLRFSNNNIGGPDNRFASTAASVTMAGGKLELFGLDDDAVGTTENRIQQLQGQLLVSAGASTIQVTGGQSTTTTLELQNPGAPSALMRESGGALHFVENPNGGTVALKLALPPIDQSVPLPWITYQDTSDRTQLGVNNFAAVEPADNGVISADSKYLYRIRPAAESWGSANGGVVSESGTAFSGTTPLTIDVYALRYFSKANSTVNILENIQITGGSILIGTNIGSATKTIQGGLITSSLRNGLADLSYYLPGQSLEGSGVLYDYDLIVHNYAPTGTFRISSEIGNNPFDQATVSGTLQKISHPVNFVHVGDGTTRLSGTNTYSGKTFANSGTIVIESAGALPGGIGSSATLSNLLFDGGVLGIGIAQTFSRNLGTAPGQVQWTGGGGFAAFGGTRDVNIGGAAAQVSWGANNFIPDGAGFYLSTANADGKVRILNPLGLGGARREFRVGDGSATEDAELLGGTSGLGGSLHKLGEGTLRLSGAGTHTRGTFLSEGTLITSSLGLGTADLEVGTTSNSAFNDKLNLIVEGGNIAGKVLVGNLNEGGLTNIRVKSNTTFGSTLTIDRPSTYLNLDPDLNQVLTVTGDVTGGAIRVGGGGTVALHGNWTGAVGDSAGAFINGGVIVRHGNVIAGANDALGVGTAVELGDSVSQAAGSTVHRSTAGRSVLSGGGIFDERSDGTPGSDVSDTGAFVFANRTTITIDGYTYGAGDVGKTILVEGESDHPERNGVYEIKYFGGPTSATTDDIITLSRVVNFNDTNEFRYGARVTVSSGTDAGSTYYVAKALSGAINTPGSLSSVIYFKKETSLNPNVGLLIDRPGILISNDIDVNSTNGMGLTTIGGALSLGAGESEFSGSIKLRNTTASVSDIRNVRLVSETSDGRGILFSGIIDEVDNAGATADSLGLTKDGLGTVTLTGNNLFKGGVVVEAGTLLVSNAAGSGTGSGTVTINNVGSRLGGNGTIAGKTTLNIGTFLSPGDPSSVLPGIGTLTFGGGLDLKADSTVELEIGSDTEYDSIQVDLAGGLTNAGAVFKVLLSYTPLTATVFDLLDWTGGAIAGLGDGLDLPELAVSNLFWNTSSFDSTGEVKIEASAGVGPPPVRFAVKEGRAVEGQVIRVALQTAWPAPSDIDVPLTISSPSDLTIAAPTTVPVHIATGESSAIVTIQVVDDPITEGEEKVSVRIGNPTGGVKGTPAAFAITIIDNDSETLAGEKWILRNPLPTNETLNDIAYAGSQGVAVGKNGTIFTSDNVSTLASWTQRKLAVSNDLNSIVRAGSEWVVVGSNGVVLTSADGVAWDIRSLGTSAAILDVTYTGTRLVAVGENGSVYTSDDIARSWTLRSSLVTATLQGVASNATRIVAVGAGGIMTTSSDGGDVWVAGDTGAAADLLSITAKSDLFVAVGVNGVLVTSADGATWNAASTVGVATRMNDVYWNGTSFLAAGAGGVVRASSNGTTWSAVTNTNVEDIVGVSHGAGLWLAAGHAGTIATSNGTTVTRVSTGTTDYLESVSPFGSSLLFAAGAGGRLVTSADGVTWTVRTSGTTNTLNGTAASATALVAVGDSGTVISSANGTSWALGTSGVGDSLRGVAFANNLFVAVGANGAITTNATPATTTWTARASGVGVVLEDVAGAANVNSAGPLFVAVGETGTVLTSPDGAAWTPAAAVPTTAGLRDVAWTGSQFVAVGVGGAIITSPDGQTWTRRNSGTTSLLEGVVLAGTRVVAVGVAGTAVDSLDGVTWTVRRTGTSETLEGLAYGGTPVRAVATGASGTIMTSEFAAAPLPQVFFAVAGQSVLEGGVAKVDVVVNLNPVADVDVKVPVSLLPGGTATTGTDFTLSVAPIVFKKGESVKKIVVTLKNEALVEADETFTLELGAPVALKTTTRPPALALPKTHLFTITNDDDTLAVTNPVQRVLPAGAIVHQVVPLGTPFSLSVTATGGDKKTVQWYKAAAKVTGAITDTYTVAAAQLTQGGAYTVKVTNPVPAATVQSTVAAEIVVIDQTDVPVPTASGGKAVLKALASGTNLTYKWFKGASEVGVGPVYTIPVVDGAAEGDYRCEVTCSAASPALIDFTGDFFVRIALPPELSTPTTVTGGSIVGSQVNGVVGKMLIIPPALNADPAKAPLAYTSTALPAGLKLDSKTGVISGVPTAATGLTPLSVTLTGNNPSGTPGTATFTINIQPVPGNAIGAFVAQVERNAGVNSGHGGRLDLVTTKLGAFSGSLLLNGVKSTFKGNMDTLPANPTGTATIVRKAPLNNIVVTFIIDVPTNGISGTVTIGADVAVLGGATLGGWRNVWGKAPLGTPATAYKGQHNVAAEISLADEGVASKPQGTGYATIKVTDTTGAAVVAGKTSDGSTIATTAPVGPSGQVLFYTSLYKSTGSVTGLAAIAADAGHTTTGTLLWSRAAQISPKDRVYRGGWGTPMELTVGGGLYIPAVAKPLPAPPFGTPPQVVMDLKEGGDKLFIARGVENKIAHVSVDGKVLNGAAFVLPDDAVGVAVDVAAGKIYWTTPDSFGRANLDGSNVVNNFIAVPVGGGAGGIALDTVNGFIYWAQLSAPSGGGLMRAKIDGTGVTQLFSAQAVTDVALDVLTNSVFYSMPNSFDIGRCDLTGGNDQRSFIPDVGGGGTATGITGLAMLPKSDFLLEGQLFWTRGDGIGRAQIIPQDLNVVNAVPDLNTFIRLVNAPTDIAVNVVISTPDTTPALDAVNTKIFWSSGTRIGRANLDGTAPAESFLTGMVDARGLDTGAFSLVNARLVFSSGGLDASPTNMNPNIGLRVKSVSTVITPLAGGVENRAGTKVSIVPATGLFSGTFTMVNPDPASTKGALFKRPVKFNGLIIPNPSTNADAFAKLDGIGAGFFLLTQLPSLPGDTLLKTPILSGQVVLEKAQ